MKVPGRLSGWCSRVTAGETPCGWFGCRRGQAARQRFLRARPSLETTHRQRDLPDAKMRCAIIAPRHAFVMQLDAVLPPNFCAAFALRIFIPHFSRVAVARAVGPAGPCTIIVTILNATARAAIAPSRAETRCRIT